MGTAEYPRYSAVLEHYGFLADPFGETLDPTLFYPARSHVQALDSLTRGIESGVPLQAITSEPGVGKTTVLHLLCDRVKDADIIFHRQPRLRAWESLKYLLLRLGNPSEASDLKALQEQLTGTLEGKRAAGTSQILIIDEAQNLDQEVLAILQSLLLPTTGQAGGLKIILAAEAGTARSLIALGLKDERLPILQLKPLELEEVHPYLTHRLRVSGYGGEEMFDQKAVRLIAEYSNGVPREINMICSEALRLCLESGSTNINEECLRQTIALRRDSLQNNATEQLVEEQLCPSSFPPSQLTGDLERWFKERVHSWSGTANELLTAIEGQAKFEDDINSERRALLLKVLHDNAGEFASRGIDISMNSSAGSPRLITLRHIDVPEGSGAPHNLVAEIPKNNEPNPTDTQLPSQSASASNARSQEGGSEAEPALTSNASIALGTNSEDSAEALRTALQSSETTSKEGSSWRKIVMIVLLIAAFVLVLVWLGRSVLGGIPQNRNQDGRSDSAGTSGSTNQGSPVLNIVRNAESGNAASQLALANMYESGEGVQKSDTDATRWLREAATQGEPEAAFRLANAYASGRGVPASKVDAYCWYVLAAAHGHSDSEQQIKLLTSQLSDGDIAAVRYQLGRMHLRGVGTRPDKAAAYFWLRLAEVAGHPAAKQAKQAVISQMTQLQIEAADERASKWLQAHGRNSTSVSRQK